MTGPALSSRSSKFALMERPIPDPPLDIRSFEAPIDPKLFPARSGGINHVGESTTAVLLVFGPDPEEVRAVKDRLQAALLPGPGSSLN